MDDKPNVGFVDPHSEGNRRHDDLDFVLLKSFLDAISFGGVVSGMIRFGRDAYFTKVLANLIDALSTEAVYNPRFSVSCFDVGCKLLEWVALLDH